MTNAAISGRTERCRFYNRFDVSLVSGVYLDSQFLGSGMLFCTSEEPPRGRADQVDLPEP